MIFKYSDIFCLPLFISLFIAVAVKLERRRQDCILGIKPNYQNFTTQLS